MSCARIYVSGVVQGVGFRYFVLDAARETDLRGWVRNMPDGRVEAEVVGERGLIMDFVSQLRIGPRSAHVTGVDVQWKPADPECTSFEIRFF
jgi:acylphosphatase